MSDVASGKHDDKDMQIEQTNGAVALDEADVEPELHWKTWVVLFAVCCCMLGTNWTVSGAGFWASATVADIGGANISLWFAEGSLVSQCVATPFFGAISDFSPLARKYCSVFLLCVAALGCYLVATAHHMYRQGLVGLLLFGAGPIAYGTQMAIISDIFPRRLRGLTGGIMYSSQALGSLGALVGGGAAIQNGPITAWRWGFYISASTMLLGAFLLTVLYKPLPRPADQTHTFGELMARFDWIGNFLFAAFILPLMMALIWGGTTYPWNSAACIACLTIGCASLVVLVLYARFYRKDGIFHHGLFKNRNYPIAVFGIFIEGYVYITLNIFLGQQIGTLYEKRPIFQGLHFGVIVILGGTASIVVGLYTRYAREIKIPLLIGFTGFVACCAGFSQLKPGQSHAASAWVLCAAIGVAFGPPLTLLITMGQLATDRDLMGLASSHIIGLRSFGGALGAAIASAIFTPKLKAYLPDRTAAFAAKAGVPAAQIPAVVSAVLASTTTPTIPGVSAAQIAAAELGKLTAYSDAFAFVYYSIIPWAIVAAICIAFSSSVKKSMSWHIDRAVEKDEDLGIDVAHHHHPTEES